MADPAAAAAALTPEQLKKRAKKDRQRRARAGRHAALAARVEADRLPAGSSEADAGTMAIAVPTEVEGAPGGGALPPSACTLECGLL